MKKEEIKSNPIVESAAAVAQEELRRGALRTLDGDASKLFDLESPEAVVTSEFGDADKRVDVIDLISKWAPDTEVVHAGGSLPPLFSDTPRPGDCRVVRFIGHDVIPAERSNLENDFVSLHFEVLNPLTGVKMGNAAMPLGAVLYEFFKVIVSSRQPEDARKLPIKSFAIGLEPSDDILLISYGGSTPSKKGEPTNLWIIEKLRAKSAAKKK